MLKYIIRRILWMIPILLGVIIIVFTINYFTTGSPAIGILGAAATPDNIATTEHEWGLDRPYFIQLGEYLWNVVTRFDFGVSYSYNRPVLEIIGERIGTTLLLGILSVVITIIIGDVETLGPSGNYHRIIPPGQYLSYDTLINAGVHPSGLCTDCQIKRIERAAGTFQTCTAQRHDSRGNFRRDHGRLCNDRNYHY